MAIATRHSTLRTSTSCQTAATGTIWHSRAWAPMGRGSSGTMAVLTDYPDVWEKLAVLDLAFSKQCETPDGCFDDIASQYWSMVDEESLQQRRVAKRFKYLGGLVNTGWQLGASHVIRLTALNALFVLVIGTSSDIISLTRSATYGLDAQGDQGCLS